MAREKTRGALPDLRHRRRREAVALLAEEVRLQHLCSGPQNRNQRLRVLRKRDLPVALSVHHQDSRHPADLLQSSIPDSAGLFHHRANTRVIRRSKQGEEPA